jgi:hypothetical protein
VISPEGCASILWRSADAAETAAVAMRMTAAEQRDLGVLDLVVPEPGEGAHTDHVETARRLRVVISDRLEALARIPLDELLERRYQRYRELGPFLEVAAPPPAIPAERTGLADRLRNLLDSGRWSGMPAGPAGRRDDPPARDEV